jgi:cobalt-zinc-cadmium efflux system protein
MTLMHQHEHARADRRLLALSLGILVAFMAAEIALGIVANSLALLADAGHMLTDASALALAVFASRGRWTFGFVRAEVLAAQANGVALLVIAGLILYSAVRRFIEPPDVDGTIVTAVALGGILVNIGVLAILRRARRQSLNVRGAYLHVATDLAAFVGTALAGLLILLTGWDRFDPIASLVVVALTLAAAASLLRESGRIFLEGAPATAPPTDVGTAIAEHEGVVEAHDLHVWTVTSGFPALSAHVLVLPEADCHRIRLQLEGMLRQRFGIEHTTLQVEHAPSASGLQIERSKTAST